MAGRSGQIICLGIVLAIASGAAWPGEIVCASQPGGYQFCRTNTADGVKLIEQTTSHACNQDNTWGFDSGGIWVANGCSARFQTGPDPKPSDDIRDRAQAGGASAIARSLTGVAPRDERKRTVKSDEAPPAAEAAAAEKSAAVPIPAAVARGATPAAQKPQTAPTSLVCQSHDYKLEKCPVPITAYVELRKKLGRAECRFNVTWGYDYGEVWVAQGCRAEFAIY